MREPATLLAVGRCRPRKRSDHWLAWVNQQMVKPESLWHRACCGGVAERLVLVDRVNPSV